MANPVYDQKLADLQRAVLETAGSVTPADRRAATERAKRLIRGEAPADRLASWIVALVDAVVKNPVATDVEGALRAGHTEDEVFEIVAAASLGAGLTRAEAGLGALKGRR